MWTLVTGGAIRLGAFICKALAQQGRSIVVHYRHSQHEAEQVAITCRSYGVQAEILAGDFSTLVGVQQFIDHYLAKFPHTETLINNVGNYLIRSASETTPEEWVDLFQTNLHAPFMLSRALIPSLIAKQGNLINIGFCSLGNYVANTHATAYYLTKLSLWGLTQSLAKELASDHVCVNMVSPGHLDNSVDLPSDLTKLPMHRPASCLEVCRVINFLLDPANHYITGQNIEVAGGVGL